MDGPKAKLRNAIIEEVTWTKDGHHITTGNGNRITLMEDGTLLISNAQLSDIGKYFIKFIRLELD